MAPLPILLEGERVVTVRPLKRGKPAFSPLEATEERLIGLIQSRQHVLQDMLWMAAYSGNSARISFNSASCS